MLQSLPAAVVAPKTEPVPSSSASPAASPGAGATPHPPVVIPDVPCFPVTAQLAAISFNPSKPIAVTQLQPFIIALRVVEGTGYYWNLRNPESDVQPPPPKVARWLGMQSIPDAADNSADKPGTPRRVGGGATDLFLFMTDNGGSTQLIFDLLPPGGLTPKATKTFTVRAGPRQVVC